MLITLKKPLFISFEGPDCVGKSTQIQLLSKFFSDQSIDHLLTQEPAKTFVGEQVSNIIRHHNIDPITETFLLLSQRFDHINKIIEPNLQTKTVITDRFHDSTIAYQVYAKAVNPKFMENLDIQMPDITFIMKLPLDIICQRIAGKKNKDNFELSGRKFFAKVIDGYDEIYKNTK